MTLTYRDTVCHYNNDVYRKLLLKNVYIILQLLQIAYIAFQTTKSAVRVAEGAAALCVRDAQSPPQAST